MQKIGAAVNLGAFYLAGIPIAVLLGFVFHLNGVVAPLPDLNSSHYWANQMNNTETFVSAFYRAFGLASSAAASQSWCRLDLYRGS